jgi:rare lipoprotein A
MRQKLPSPPFCVACFLLLSLFLGGCFPKQRAVVGRPPQPAPEVPAQPPPPAEPSREEAERRETRFVQYGIASWYGPDFHGKPTSSGEIYDMYQLTCAHQTLPLGTAVIVTNLENGRSLELRVNDRGPFVKDRIIDLTYSAARLLGIYEKGTATVKVEALGPVVIEPQRYSLQVGSFTDEALAQRLAEELRKRFPAAHVTTMETLTQKYHRVRVGPFDTREASLPTAGALSRMGYKVLITTR